MKLYISQHIFSWNDRFTVQDAWGNDRYYVEGELFSWGKKLHVYDLTEREVAYIEQKVWRFLPEYHVYVNDVCVAEIVKEFTFFTPRYSIEGLGWEIRGDFLLHDYHIYSGQAEIVSIHKAWMTWGDCYELDIADPADELEALSVVLTIDCVMASNN